MDGTRLKSDQVSGTDLGEGVSSLRPTHPLASPVFPRPLWTFPRPLWTFPPTALVTYDPLSHPGYTAALCPPPRKSPSFPGKFFYPTVRDGCCLVHNWSPTPVSNPPQDHRPQR